MKILFPQSLLDYFDILDESISEQLVKQECSVVMVKCQHIKKWI